MQTLTDFLAHNKDWLFSGLGITVATMLAFTGRWVYQVIRGRRPPDLRVEVMPALTYHPALGSGKVLSITVQNHSSFPAFITGFYIEMRDKQKLVVKSDGVTGGLQGKQELAPSDSSTFYIARNHLRSYLAQPGRALSDFTRAFVVDAVGRRYYSSGKECRAAIAEVLT